MTKDGDWLRLGEAGVPYYQLPGGGTRWESLHIVQGIIECYLITGEERYKNAAVSLWESLRRFDRHPSGAFSTNECAYGSPYALGAIETCCSVAWEALTIDVLRLTGDARVADELELTTWNQVLAAQHPSGSWWTYDTPMDGVRVPSFQHISFQYRPGTPELNCCSVNAPRGLGMLSEWAVLEDDEGLVVNFYGPGRFDIERKSGERVVLTQETAYPLSGAISITVQPTQAAAFTLRLRVPEWSRHTTVAVNGRPLEAVPVPGTYLAVKAYLDAWRSRGTRPGHGPALLGGRGGALRPGPPSTPGRCSWPSTRSSTRPKRQTSRPLKWISSASSCSRLMSSAGPASSRPWDSGK